MDTTETKEPQAPSVTTRYAVQVVVAVEKYDAEGRLLDARQSQPTTLAVLSETALREAWAGLLDNVIGAVNVG